MSTFIVTVRKSGSSILGRMKIKAWNAEDAKEAALKRSTGLGYNMVAACRIVA